MYPGRSTCGLVLVFNKHGQPIIDDAFPGIAFTHGIGIDRKDNLYVMAMASRTVNGKRYFNEATDCLVKVKPKKAM